MFFHFRFIITNLYIVTYTDRGTPTSEHMKRTSCYELRGSHFESCVLRKTKQYFHDFNVHQAYCWIKINFEYKVELGEGLRWVNKPHAMTSSLRVFIHNISIVLHVI